MHSLPDHAWMFYLGDGQVHEWPVPLAPDEEGIVTSLCDVEAMPFRLAAEDRTGRCPTCSTLLPLGDGDTRCHRCDSLWAAQDRPRLAVDFDALRCFTCLLRAGSDYGAGLAERRVPDPIEFRYAVSAMRTDGPDVRPGRSRP